MIDEEPHSPGLVDIFEAALAANSPFKCEPGKVVRYDATRQLVDVQPLIKEIIELEDGTTSARERPVIPNVPVVFQGGGGFTLTFPVTAGDLVVLIYAHAALDRWLESDGRKLIDPGDPRTNSSSDAFAFVSPATARNPRKQIPTDRIRLGHDTASGAAIKITPTTVEIDNGSGSVFLPTMTAINNIVTWLTTHTHPTVAVSGLPAPITPATTVLKGK